MLQIHCLLYPVMKDLNLIITVNMAFSNHYTNILFDGGGKLFKILQQTVDNMKINFLYFFRVKVQQEREGKPLLTL